MVNWAEMPVIKEMKDGAAGGQVQPSLSSHVDPSPLSNGREPATHNLQETCQYHYVPTHYGLPLTSPTLSNGTNGSNGNNVSPPNFSLINGNNVSPPNVSLINGVLCSYDPPQQSNGVFGFNGFTGFEGLHALNGTQGVNAHGFNGAHALNGANNFTGANGVDGMNGASGLQRTIGADGFNAANSANGAIGTNGLDVHHSGANVNFSTQNITEQIRNAQQETYAPVQHYSNGFVPTTNGNSFASGVNPFLNGNSNPIGNGVSQQTNGATQYVNGVNHDPNAVNVFGGNPLANAIANSAYAINSPPGPLNPPTSIFGPMSLALPNLVVPTSLVQMVANWMTPMLGNAQIESNGQVVPYRGNQAAVYGPPPPPVANITPRIPLLAGMPLQQLQQLDERCVGKVFVGGLSQSTDNEGLAHFFRKFGPVKEGFIKLDSDTQRSRGFGFVTFENTEDAQRAIDGGPHQLDGKNLDVKHAIPHHLTANPHFTASTKKIYVGGLPRSVDDATLRAHFEQFGELECAMVMRDQAGNSRGFGFVTYKDPKQANHVAQIRFHTIHQSKVECKYSQPKNTLEKEGARNGVRANGGRQAQNARRLPAIMPPPIAPVNGHQRLMQPRPAHFQAPHSLRSIPSITQINGR